MISFMISVAPPKPGATSRMDALDMLALASVLHRRLDNAGRAVTGSLAMPESRPVPGRPSGKIRRDSRAS
jgi:hypothetical protein